MKNKFRDLACLSWPGLVFFALFALAQGTPSAWGSADMGYSLKLLKSTFERGPNQNILVSPSSLKSALGLLMKGSTVAEQQHILSSMGFEGVSPNRFFSEIAHHEALASTPREGFQLLSSNAVFLNAEIDPAYHTGIREGFRAGYEEVDFASPMTARK